MSLDSPGPRPLTPKIKLMMSWGQMSTLVRYAIVVECAEIVFADGSRAVRRVDVLGTWDLQDMRYSLRPETEALAFVRRQNAVLPYLWIPSPALLAKAMDELRKRRAKG